MTIEELKKVCDILSNSLACHKNDNDCDGECDICSYDVSVEDYDKALDTAITVIGDVIKQMEKMQKGDHGQSREEGSTED